MIEYKPGNCYLSKDNIIVMIIGIDNEFEDVIYTSLRINTPDGPFTISFVPIKKSVLDENLVDNLLGVGTVFPEILEKQVKDWATTSKCGKTAFTCSLGSIITLCLQIRQNNEMNVMALYPTDTEGITYQKGYKDGQVDSPTPSL